MNAKKALTRAIAIENEIAAKWCCLSGFPGYDAARSFAEQEEASRVVRDLARIVGTSKVGTKLYSERFPDFMKPHFDKLRQLAV